MKPEYRIYLVLFCGFTVFIASTALWSGVSGNDRFVGAYYYSWYDQAYWNEFPNLAVYPSLGKYDSSNETVLRQHLVWAEEAGLDFLAVSLWSEVHVNTEPNFQKLLALPSSTKLCVLLEAYPEVFSDSSELSAYADHIYSAYADSERYFRLYGKPLLFVFVVDTQFLSWNDNRFTVRILNLHSPYVGQDPRELVGDILTVYPGFDDTTVPGRQQPWKRDRQEGAWYENQWKRVLSIGKTFSGKTLVTMVTSFNEVPEQSFIEPSPWWGQLYLDLTRQYANQFRIIQG